MPRFIHTADIHLDSPLQKLESYEGAPVAEIRGATRRALERLVDLAIAENVDFVVIAGDLYDGDWRDQQTGLFFVRQAARLVHHNIPLYVIRGNHDAASVMTQSLPLPKNPDGTSILLSANRAETVRMERIGFSIHGQSFGARAESENMAASYPPADKGMFNLGMLHTSLTGAEGHAPYAPCSPGMLADKGYDYWALGHIHTRGEHHIDGAAPIVFCGNPQGRHSRETGPKGCILVDVDASGETTRTFRPLDVVRWEICEVDAGRFDDADAILEHFADWVDSALEECGEASLVARLRISGATPLHDSLLYRKSYYESAARARALERGLGRVWVESLRVRTRPPTLDDAPLMDGPVASVLDILAEYESGNIKDPNLIETLTALQRKVPQELFQVDMQELLGDARAALVGRLRGDTIDAPPEPTSH